MAAPSSESACTQSDDKNPSTEPIDVDEITKVIDKLIKNFFGSIALKNRERIEKF